MGLGESLKIRQRGVPNDQLMVGQWGGSHSRCLSKGGIMWTLRSTWATAGDPSIEPLVERGSEGDEVNNR